MHIRTHKMRSLSHISDKYFILPHNQVHVPTYFGDLWCAAVFSFQCALRVYCLYSVCVVKERETDGQFIRIGILVKVERVTDISGSKAPTVDHNWSTAQTRDHPNNIFFLLVDHFQNFQIYTLLFHSTISLVGRPTRCSLLFSFVFLFWSSNSIQITEKYSIVLWQCTVGIQHFLETA